MSRWVDFRELRQGLDIEQVLTSYHVPLERVGLDQLRGPCPLPTHSSEQSRKSFSVDTAKNVWACHSASCSEVRQGRVGGNVLDLVAVLEGCSIRDAALRLLERWCGGRAARRLANCAISSGLAWPGNSASSIPYGQNIRTRWKQRRL
jgi:CHC2 zinc finger